MNFGHAARLARSQLELIAARRKQFFERIVADRAGRSGRAWVLTRTFPFEGESMTFGGAGAIPDHLRHEDEIYARVS